ncbi:MAG: hypothetical protein A2735_00235 [Candidatus Yanofskybacteria bacterium RIFCSPHIGHO2_01_FULL_41_21]|uniref:DUF2784 domain-containing protein n=1 Tax=Candidatus Yanofskybacteria bacterium RIFCSPHIGHO2_01_FULL_41_21 TaxID=1802660 RepID=A0A1F8EB56_9BACT|nr:MAG: hypothetical protein A2735_00235 [Candidatus Yanofskybacteria bacterium RIFCSPHIGHO2_01_FULL_41_21]
MRKFAVQFVVVIHTLFFLAILACLPIAIIYPSSHKAILWFVGIVLVSQIPYRACVLTRVEQALRGDHAYHGTFLSHYLEHLFNVEVSDRVVNIFTAIYFITTILIAVFYRLNQAF